ncbi:MAG: acyl-CoA dehydratase activase [Candidatus Bathyarchaeia archaeon]|jgi:predicted CoA-substrate-specific enzyme activase
MANENTQLKQSPLTYSIGIDAGYSSVKIALLENGAKQVFSKYSFHDGKVREKIEQMITELSAEYDMTKIVYGAITGSGLNFLHQNAEIKYVNDVAAIVEGALNICRDAQSIVEIGGEGATYITGFNSDSSSGIQISMNPSCSAGTGSFLEEQISRLNLNLADYSNLSMKATSIPRIAGRCSVFAKTDIIHHQQEGVPIPDILVGLAYSVVRNYRCAVIKRLPIVPPILFVGGVANNQAIIKALKDILQLDSDELVVPKNFDTVSAVGVALLAFKGKHPISLRKLLSAIKNQTQTIRNSELLYSPLSRFGDSNVGKMHVCSPLKSTQVVSGYLGVDVGSTTTKLVLIDEENNILGYQYLRTQGKPIDAVQRGLNIFKEQFSTKVKIKAVGATGSGRYLAADYLGADVVKDEITAQATGSRTLDPYVDTIFEIGGQDSKYIYLKDGVVTDFQMNKICAAGTGSFIEEQAQLLKIPLNEFSSLSLSSDNPANLGERCAVFIGTNVASKLSEGEPLRDITAGLCYSIVKNYLNRVVGAKKIGAKIFLQGGIAYNQSVVNAFKALVGDRLIVPPFFSITGALGAAILAKENKGTTKFKGYEVHEIHKIALEEENGVSAYDNSINKMVFEDYTSTLDHSKKTVGIPRALFSFGLYPMFNTFFKELGFNVLLSEPTSEESIKRGQEYLTDETCFPVKLVTGHVAELMEKKVDYIFFPNLYTVEHSGSHSRQNYGCPYMQLAFKMVNYTMELKKKGIELLSPTMAFNQGPEFMNSSFIKIGNQLGKTPEETIDALKKGNEAFMAFRDRMIAHAEKNYSASKDKKVIILISKMYGVADPVLNMGIPRKLEQLGYHVIPFFDFTMKRIEGDYPNMYWPFGVHILEAAKLVRQNSNMHAIFLTHHGCGPDAVVSHYFQEIMNGKPYLNIEVDEHSSKVGVITRVEAFINSLENNCAINAPVPEVNPQITTNLKALEHNTVLYLPYLYPYSQIFQRILERNGQRTKILPEPSPKIIEEGRKHVFTSEYYSVTSVLGMALNGLSNKTADKVAVYLPQNEGAEMSGQLARLLWTKLYQNEQQHVTIVSPYIEDFFNADTEDFQLISNGLILGDIIYTTPLELRQRALKKGLELIDKNNLENSSIIKLARWVKKNSNVAKNDKSILAIGEALILYNGYMNNHTLTRLEKNGHRVLFSPLSETLWMFWRDYVNFNVQKRDIETEKRLDSYKENILKASKALEHLSPFENDLDLLLKSADATVGYYTGANGRYRAAKLVCQTNKVAGAIAVSSLYENTGIALNTIHKCIEESGSPPLLNLTFDGTSNDKDLIKIDSFIHFLNTNKSIQKNAPLKTDGE